MKTVKKKAKLGRPYKTKQIMLTDVVPTQPKDVPENVRLAYPHSWRAHRRLHVLATRGEIKGSLLANLVQAMESVRCLAKPEKLRKPFRNVKSLHASISMLLHGTYYQVEPVPTVIRYQNGTSRTTPPGLHSRVGDEVAQAVAVAARLVHFVRNHGYLTEAPTAVAEVKASDPKEIVLNRQQVEHLARTLSKALTYIPPAGDHLMGKTEKAAANQRKRYRQEVVELCNLLMQLLGWPSFTMTELPAAESQAGEEQP